MSYEQLYLELITRLLTGELRRDEVSDVLAKTVPIDIKYIRNAELLTNCEWALRHVSEINFFTSEKELAYYARCLRNEELFSALARDRAMAD